MVNVFVIRTSRGGTCARCCWRGARASECNNLIWKTKEKVRRTKNIKLRRKNELERTQTTKIIAWKRNKQLQLWKIPQNSNLSNWLGMSPSVHHHLSIHNFSLKPQLTIQWLLSVHGENKALKYWLRVSSTSSNRLVKSFAWVVFWTTAPIQQKQRKSLCSLVLLDFQSLSHKVH